MRRIVCLSLLSVAMLSPWAQGTIIVFIQDPIDDVGLVNAVSGQRPVKQLGSDIEAMQRAITVHKRDRIEKLLGHSAPKPTKDYAMPVAQPRCWGVSGIRYSDSSMNKDHTEFYTIGDFAGIEVWYGIDGETPRFALLYFKIDDAFPKLKQMEEKAARVKGPPAVPLRKNTISRESWDKHEIESMSKKYITALCSVPPGDYAPWMEYLSRPYGQWTVTGAKAYKTLEWRGEKGRLVAGFDREGELVSAEFFEPGRDPSTNITERLNWDHKKFDQVKKYVKARMKAK